MTTITQEQFETACRDSGLFAKEATLLIDSLGITIAPAEPPAEMVKLAREAFCKDDSIEEASAWPVYRAAYLAALQHAVDVVKGAPVRGRSSGESLVAVGDILTALGAGGRDAG